MGSVGDKVPVLDLKPLSHNPFLDGTVVYDNAEGVLVPRSVAGAVEPLGGNPFLEGRPSNASTQALIDSARKTTRIGVAIDDVALRGYRNVFGGLDTEKFGAAVDNMTDAQLDDFIQAVTDDLAASRQNAKAMLPRVSANQVLRRGSQLAGALGYVMDAYNIADAVLDPTNNPLDEIGDVAGSMIGGALGTPLGPVGVLAGSLIGGWLGRQLGNLLQGNGQQKPQGETVTIAYEFHAWYTAEKWLTTTQEVVLPFDFARGPCVAASAVCIVADWGTGSAQLTGSAYEGDEDKLSIRNIRVVPPGTDPASMDNNPNAVPYDPGNPNPFAGPAPSYPRLDQPIPYGPQLDNPPLIDPLGDLPPDPTGELMPAPEGDLVAPTGDPFVPPGGGAGLDSPTVPDDLPAPRKSPEPGPTIDPNAPLTCCDLNALNIEQLLRDVQVIKAHFQAAGFATLNLPVCDESSPHLLLWEGAGLVGIYDALETLSAATNRLWAQVKCPPETTAAVPMVWETKVQEHAQLIVLWGPAEGGSSRWSMHIPHPRANLSASYAFSFPQYTKGPVSGALVLQDNTRVVVNGASEAECKKVLSYVRGLIDPRYTSSAKEVFTKGGAKFSVVPVKAVYIKAFEGHKNQAPLWSKSL